MTCKIPAFLASLLVLGFLLPSAAISQSIFSFLSSNSDADFQEILSKVRVFRSSKPLSAEDALRRFKTEETQALDLTHLHNFGADTSALWLTFSLDNTDASLQEYLLEVSNSHLEHVDLWTWRQQGKELSWLNHQVSGLHIPLSKRPINSARIIFPAEIPASESLVFLLKISGQKNQKVQLSLAYKSLILSNFNTQDLTDNFFIAGIILISIFDILLYILLWKKVYVIFLAFLLLSSVHSFILSNFGISLFNSSLPNIYGPVSFLLAIISLWCLLEYCRKILNQNQKITINSGIPFIYTSVLLCMIIYFFNEYWGRILIFIPFQSIIIILFIKSFKRKKNQGCRKDLHTINLIQIVLGLNLITSIIFISDYLGFPAEGPFVFLNQYNTHTRNLTSALILSYLLFRQLYQLEHQKEEAEEMSRISRSFLSSISHELKSPLNGIIGYAQNLELAYETRQIAEYQKHIEDEARVLLNKVDRVLDIVRLESGKIDINPVQFSPVQFLRKIHRQWSADIERKGLKFSLNLDPALNTLVSADQLRLEQMLDLLLDNALRYTSSGEISLSGQVLSLEAQGMICRFSVRDTGCGIPAGKLQKILSLDHPLQEDKEAVSGFGIGLPLILRLASLMQAQLSAESTENQGSSFHINLLLNYITSNNYTLRNNIKTLDEIAANPENPDETPVQENLGPDLFSPASNNGFKIPRILVVDDLPTNRQVVSIHLSKMLLDIDEAENGREALHRFEQNSYNLVLMDIYMPEMDGYEASRRLRTRFNASELPIIGLTASTEEEDLRDCIAAGMNSFLLKPLSKEKLLSTLQEYIELKTKD